MTTRELTDVALAHRVDALGRFVDTVVPHVVAAGLPGADLGSVQSFVERATTRLRLSAADAGGHTVVALAGATGGGKSSLFNALAHLTLSPVGHLRPTTGAAHACVWGPRGADDLLNWLGVASTRRSVRESALDAEDEAALRGLVLLDLPDMDTLAVAHRNEADRLVGIVDLVIWVLDPQKYADQTVHEHYLREMGPLRDVTMVVLNQIDRLSPADAARCRADLTRLVDADGLPGVPIVATSAVTGEGVDELRALLEKTVGGRHAAAARIEGELAATAARLSPLVADGLVPTRAPRGRGVDHDGMPGGAVPALADELATAAGVDAVAARSAQVHAALSRLPLRRRAGAEPAIPPAEPAAVRLAVRRFATSAGHRLPSPWPEQVWSAARLRLEALPNELAQVLTVAKPFRPRAYGWGLARAGFWLGLLLAVAGAGGLVYAAVRHTARPIESLPHLGPVSAPWLVLALGVILAAGVLLLRPLARIRTRRYHEVVQNRLREAVGTVAAEVAVPVQMVLRDHETARGSLLVAAQVDVAPDGQLTAA